MKRDSNTKQYEHMMHCGYGVLVWCKAHSLAPASRCGDVSDPVVLHAARSWIPPGVHTGGGFVKHNQVGGRSKRYWKMHTHTHISQLQPCQYIYLLLVVGARFPWSSLKYLLKAQSLISWPAHAKMSFLSLNDSFVIKISVNLFLSDAGFFT